MKNLKPYAFLLASFSVFAGSLCFAGYEPAPLSAAGIVAATNTAREQAGLPPLSIDFRLQNAAADKSEDMGVQLYFAHENPEGLTPWYWFAKNQYPFIHAGENLAINYNDPDELLAAWLNSPEHRANILNPDYQDIGVEVKTVKTGGKEYTFVVQLFGAPDTLAVR